MEREIIFFSGLQGMLSWSTMRRIGLEVRLEAWEAAMGFHPADTGASEVCSHKIFDRGLRGLAGRQEAWEGRSAENDL